MATKRRPRVEPDPIGDKVLTLREAASKLKILHSLVMPPKGKTPGAYGNPASGNPWEGAAAAAKAAAEKEAHVRLTGAILGALYSDLRDTALVVRALCHFRSRFLGAVRHFYRIQTSNPDSIEP